MPRIARLLSDLEQSGTAARGQPRAGSECPDDEIWGLLADGLLSSEHSTDVRRHAERCQSCHLTLAGLGLVSEVDFASAPTEAVMTETRPAAAGHLVDEGTLIGRHVVVARLGEGGMGVVYKAYDPELDRHVALKVLKTSASTGRGELVSRLQREARSMAKLSHPNVVTVYDVGLYGDALYVAMELVQGGTLDAQLSGGGHALAEVVRYFRDVARALGAAHDRGLVHRDLKPQNVLVSREGIVKVTDFGLARSAAERVGEGAAKFEQDAHALVSTAITRTGQILGTPAYMAPEQFAGAPTDTRTDVFSFGVALHEAVLGDRPFAGLTVTELRANVLAGRRRPMARERSPFRGAAFDVVATLIDQCLAVEPAQRPSMHEVENTLESFRMGLLAPSAPTPAPALPAPAPASKPTRAAWAGGGLAAFLIGALCIGIFAARTSSSAPATSATSATSATPSAVRIESSAAPTASESRPAGAPPATSAAASIVAATAVPPKPLAPHKATTSTSATSKISAPRVGPNGAPILQ